MSADPPAAAAVEPSRNTRLISLDSGRGQDAAKNQFHFHVKVFLTSLRDLASLCANGQRGGWSVWLISSVKPCRFHGGATVPDSHRFPGTPRKLETPLAMAAAVNRPVAAPAKPPPRATIGVRLRSVAQLVQRCRCRGAGEATGNPVEIRDCPAAVSGNERRHTSTGHRSVSGKRRPVGDRRNADRARESEYLPVACSATAELLARDLVGGSSPHQPATVSHRPGWSVLVHPSGSRGTREGEFS